MLSSSSQIIPPHCQWIRLQQTEAHPFTFTPTHQPAPIPSNYLGPLGASSSNKPTDNRTRLHIDQFIERVIILIFSAADHRCTTSLASPSLRLNRSNKQLSRRVGFFFGSGLDADHSPSFLSSADHRCTTSLASPSLRLDRLNEQSSRKVAFFFGSRPPLHDIPSLPQPSPRPIERTIESKSRLFFRFPTIAAQHP
ncbi:hypothetical protein PGT21_012376 [Puccinia graminis f. sp. tritici]|uniref:Uncharacterized protein n=1 Tax=Puccinia graminis f. sp. tritici TaxID=56615 RepID=A0A5B0QSZ9_PUCGR|nr:hypothetical protein PGT21_012376 [Puccinia graminis f. sp. tritici]